MPYRVEELPEPGNYGEDMMNDMEDEGWTLVHIIQGFVSAHEDGVSRIYWRPRFVFHKP